MKKSSIKIRTRIVDSVRPPIANLIINHYLDNSESNCSFVIPDVVTSVNHIKKMGYNRKTGKPFPINKEEYNDFKALTYYSTIKQKGFKPKGITSCIIIFEMATWITKEHKIRVMDCDNRIKPTLDSIKHAIGVDDERYWHEHIFKAVGKKNRTHVWLFDLGDIVNVTL